MEKPLQFSIRMSVAVSLYDACDRLKQAYKAGEDEGSSMDWNDVDDAWTMAKAAIRKFNAESKKPLKIGEDRVPMNVKSAAAVQQLLGACERLVQAYKEGARNREHIDWSDVDQAHELAIEAMEKFDPYRPKEVFAAANTGSRKFSILEGFSTWGELQAAGRKDVVFLSNGEKADYIASGRSVEGVIARITQEKGDGYERLPNAFTNTTIKASTRSLCEAVAALAKSFAVAEYAPANSADFADLCIEWAEAFEVKNANRKWDGEFPDEIEEHFTKSYGAWVSRTDSSERRVNSAWNTAGYEATPDEDQSIPLPEAKAAAGAARRKSK
jgi:hypothetical protein